MKRLIDLLKKTMKAVNKNDERSNDFHSELEGIRCAACCFGVVIEPVVDEDSDYNYVGFYITKNETKTYYEL